jgi:hypothetical protein
MDGPGWAVGPGFVREQRVVMLGVWVMEQPAFGPASPEAKHPASGREA